MSLAISFGFDLRISKHLYNIVWNQPSKYTKILFNQPNRMEIQEFRVRLVNKIVL